MDGNGDNVTLIVKNHHHDETVQCSSSWSIERLKGHIAELYPNKPNPADLKLIYYGRVLDDSQTLGDVFNRFDPEASVHTMHLVGVDFPPYPQSAEAVTSRMDGDGGIPTPQSPMAQPPFQEAPATPEDALRFFMNPAGYQPWMNQANSGYFQQLAWAQQAYANYYMSQYMDMLARHNGGNPMYAPAADVPRPPEPVPPRVDDDERNRDWLDYFYILARLVVLFSIVYFYSSPARFMIVSFLGVAMYLYQVGFFRINPVQAFENNNELLNNNVAAENNNLVQGGDVAAARVEPQEPAVVEEVAPQTVEPVNARAVERPSLIALTWTFFSSFIASLIPDTQNAI